MNGRRKEREKGRDQGNRMTVVEAMMMTGEALDASKLTSI